MNKKNICLNTNFKIGCEIQVEKFKSDGTITYKGPKFHNLILDCGLDNLYNHPIWYTYHNSMLEYCNVGTGNSTPIVSQTGLDNRIASSNSFYTQGGCHYSLTDPVYTSKYQTHQFSVGSCTGNLTEVGFSYDNNSTYLNRQLFKDEHGDPTTITVLSDEGLRVSSEVFLYSHMIPGESLSGSFYIDDTLVEYDKEINPEIFSSTNFYINMLGNTFGSFMMSRLTTNTSSFRKNENYSSSSGDSYVNGSFEHTKTFIWNAGWTDIGCFLIVYNTWSTDEALTRYNLREILTYPSTTELTMTAKVSWGRA